MGSRRTSCGSEANGAISKRTTPFDLDHLGGVERRVIALQKRERAAALVVIDDLFERLRGELVCRVVVSPDQKTAIGRLGRVGTPLDRPMLVSPVAKNVMITLRQCASWTRQGRKMPSLVLGRSTPGDRFVPYFPKSLSSKIVRTSLQFPSRRVN